MRSAIEPPNWSLHEARLKAPLLPADYSGDADYFTHQGSCGGFDLHLADRPDCGHNCSRPMWEARGIYSTHLFTDRAVSLIDAHDPPHSLFLYLPYQVPSRHPRAKP